MRFSYAESMCDPSFYIPLAKAAEEAGYTSVTIPDSICYPEDSESKYPYNGTGDRAFLSDKPFIEPFSLIPALGAVTSTIRFTTFVVKLPIRSPVLVAKSVSSVAVMTNDRFGFDVRGDAVFFERTVDGKPLVVRARFDQAGSHKKLEATVGQWRSRNGALEGFANDRGVEWRKYTVRPGFPKDSPSNLAWLPEKATEPLEAFSLAIDLAPGSRAPKLCVILQGDGQRDALSGWTLILEPHGDKVRAWLERYDLRVYESPMVPFVVDDKKPTPLVLDWFGKRLSVKLGGHVLFDQAPLLANLLKALAAFPEIEVIGSARDGESGVDEMVKLVPQLALLDLELPGIDGIEVTALAPAELRRFRRHAQIIFQDPYGSLNPRLRVAEALAEPLRIHGLIRADTNGPSAKKRSSAELRDEEAARIGALLEQVGLSADSGSRYPHEFSGGQRQRIVIARALAVEPRFIVADEAVSALDVSIQAQIINLLRDVQRKKGLTYLFISHDLKVVEHLCEQVAVMYLGRIVEIADTPRLYGRPRHPYTQALLSAVPDPPDAPSLTDSAADAETLSRMPDVPIEALRHGRVLLSGEMPSILQPPTGCAFHPRCPRYAVKGQPAICRTETPVLRSMLDEHDPKAALHRVACHLA